jgi:mono/diheme cytochrome c family protein
MCFVSNLPVSQHIKKRLGGYYMKIALQKAVIVAFGVAWISSSIYLAHTVNSPVQNKNTSENGRNAAALFGKDCATCHGKDGQAKTFKAKLNHARNLTDATWQAGVTDERLFNSITNGRYKMPPFGKKLTEAEINSLVGYVRSLKT